MEKNYYKDYFQLEKNHWFFKVRRKILLYFIGKNSKKGDVILDFGCGSGFLVGQLQKLGFDAYGLDFEGEAIEYGEQKGIKNLSVSNTDKINYEDNKFDLIMSFDVLEHLEKEESTIKEFIRVLRPGGKIIITVPAYQWLWGVQDEISHHFRRYTISSLQKVFGDYDNLKLIHKTYFNTLLFPVIALVRVLSRWLNIQNRDSDFQIGNRFLNKMFYSIFNIEYYLLKFMRFFFGVSILMVLEKKHG